MYLCSYFLWQRGFVPGISMDQEYEMAQALGVRLDDNIDVGEVTKLPDTIQGSMLKQAELRGCARKYIERTYLATNAFVLSLL